ncbi:MAG: hypothetical protein RLZZ196_1326 [Bacteroidota bacterium]|jgi:hypothetical protein
MNITEISKKYNISEAFLGSKEDGLMIAAASLKDLQNALDANQPRGEIKAKMQFLIDFLTDLKNSSWTA